MVLGVVERWFLLICEDNEPFEVLNTCEIMLMLSKPAKRPAPDCNCPLQEQF